MREYVTPAIVLGIRPVGEQDRVADLFTKDLGRLRARVVGGRKLLSKFAPHLTVLALVTVRLVRKHHFTVADAAADQLVRRPARAVVTQRRALEMAFLLRSVLPEMNPDVRLWYYVRYALTESAVRMSSVLKLLGYDPFHARCEHCGGSPVTNFSVGDQSFLCARCGVKVPPGEVLLIH